MKKDKGPKPLPDRAVSVMMTPKPKQNGSFWTPGMHANAAWKQPTAIVLYFEGHGLRRVYRREKDGVHIVKINRRFHRVDIETMSLQKPTGKGYTREEAIK